MLNVVLCLQRRQLLTSVQLPHGVSVLIDVDIRPYVIKRKNGIKQLKRTQLILNIFSSFIQI